MILETTNPDFMTILKNSVPEYSHLKVKVVDKDGQVFNRTLAWSTGKAIMMLGYRRKHYGSYVNWDYFKSVIIPDKKEKTEKDKWVRSWTNVLNRLEKSGLWEDVAKDVRIALDVGYDKMKQAYTQYWEKIKEIDERLVEYRDDGTPFANTSIIWYMSKTAKVKKMHFGGKWLNDRELADIANALENKLPIRVGTDGRITKGYDVSYNYQPEDNKAWYSEEYRGCGNGHYYLALDATHAVFYEDD
jgi:hypothetical protein